MMVANQKNLVLPPKIEVKCSSMPVTTASDVITRPLNFYGALFLLPFRLRWDPLQSRFVPSCSKIQKIVCALIHSISILLTFWFVMSSFIYKNQESLGPRAPFFLVNKFAFVFANGFIIWISWKSSHTFCQVATNLRELQMVHSDIFIKYVSIFICVIPLISGSLSFHSDYQDTFHDMINEDAGLKKVGYSVLLLIAYIAHLFENMIEAVALMILFPIYLYILHFEAQLLNRHIILDEVSFKKLKMFEEIVELITHFMCHFLLQVQPLITSVQNFIKLCNDSLYLGHLMFLMFLDCILSYSIKISAGLMTTANGWNEGLTDILTHFPTAMQVLSFWFLAAEVNRRAHTCVHDFIQSWQSSKKKEDDAELGMILDQVKLLTISNQFQSCPVGISCRFFTVTYGFISSVGF